MDPFFTKCTDWSSADPGGSPLQISGILSLFDCLLCSRLPWLPWTLVLIPSAQGSCRFPPAALRSGNGSHAGDSPHLFPVLWDHCALLPETQRLEKGSLCKFCLFLLVSSGRVKFCLCYSLLVGSRNPLLGFYIMISSIVLFTF